MHDIVVVGAGPAGTSFALFAARKGFDVAVLDVNRFRDIWTKPCGDGIDRRIFRELEISPPSGRELRNEVTAAEVHSPDYSFSSRVEGPGYIINRNELGKRLAEEAVDEGAQFIMERPCIGLLLGGGRVQGVVARTGEGTEEFQANLTVDCTGASGVVKSRLPADWPVSEKVRDFALCYRGILELGKRDERDVIHIYTDQDIAPGGYWWLFPGRGGRANVGLGLRDGDPAALKKGYAEILSRLQVNGKVQEAGARVPVQRPPSSLVGPGVLVLGDAAPTVSPLTGGGLSLTMRAAHRAASHLDDVAADDWSYESAWAMNEYIREEGAHQAAEDVVKIAMWELGGEFIESCLGALSGGTGMLKVLLDADMRDVAVAARRVKKHYEKFPGRPEGLRRWAARRDDLFGSLDF